LYNGVDIEKFCPSTRKRREGRVRLSFHGRWSEKKGILVLLRAVRILESKRSDFECYIAGSPEVPFPTPESRRVGDVVLEMMKGLRSTKLVGAMPHDDLPAFIQDMDLGIVPTISPEPFGIVNLEYMACGLPVIATRTGGIPEIVATERQEG
jgi:glycosyltransferase involved in cell wall biosynthesis